MAPFPGLVAGGGQWRRRLVRVGLAGLFVAVSVSAVPPVAASIGALPMGEVGVNSIATRLPDQRDATLDHIASQRFTSVRLHIEWPAIEPYEGHFDWAATDDLVRAAADRGLAILGVVTYAPWWAAIPEGSGALHPGPTDPVRYGAFAGQVAERYHDQIHAWEIWNEPNIVQNFAPAPDVGRYAAMLIEAYNAIKAVQPAATVVAGGTSPAVDTQWSLAPATFVQALYDFGAGEHFDAVAMHPYCGPELLSEPGESRDAIAAVSKVLASHGQAFKQIWFTEFGASTTPGIVWPDGHIRGVDEVRQAQILVDGINYLRALPNGGPIFIFDYRDLDSASTTPDFRFGLIRSDMSPKPSLAAVTSALGRQPAAG